MPVARRSAVGSQSPSGKGWSLWTIMTSAPLAVFKGGYKLKSLEFLTHSWKPLERNKPGAFGEGKGAEV